MASNEFMSSEYLNLDPFRERQRAEQAGMNGTEYHGDRQDLYRAAQINREMLERMTNNKKEWA